MGEKVYGYGTKAKINEVLMREVLEVEFEGKSYRVTYSVEKDMITVRTAFDSKPAVVGASPPEVLARIMAGEMLADAKRKGLL